MSRYRITPRALRDIDAIADYSLENWGERQTAKYLGELDQRFRWLAQNPLAGRARDEVGEGYRNYPQGAHIIFYALIGADIAVIGVPHGSLDLEAYFETPE